MVSLAFPDAFSAALTLVMDARDRTSAYREPLPSGDKYPTIEVATAKKHGYRPITRRFGVRNTSQRDMLDHAIADLSGIDIVLVRVGGFEESGALVGGFVTIWRK